MDQALPQDVMKAITINGKGGPDCLQFTDRPVPKPQSGEVLIKVMAAGINRADTLQRKGHYPPPQGASDLPGLEVAGIVAQSYSDAFKLGDAVCALIPGGGYAEYAIAAQECVLPKPQNLSFVEAASIIEAAFTVYNNVFYRGGLNAGETLLLTGASSGIGTMAIQMAKVSGATVIGLCSADKIDAVKALGADQVFDYRAAETWDAIGPVDVVLDMVGGEDVQKHIEKLKTDGRHVTIAYPKGQTASVDMALIMRKRLVVTGSTLRGRPLAEQKGLRDALLAEFWPLFATGTIKPVIDTVLPLAQAAKAHEVMEAGRHVGKIVLQIAE
jgi:NADPH2:quinone reductase